MLSGSQARPTMAMIESYLTLIQDLPSGDDGQNPSAQAKNNLAQALIQSCEGCSPTQRACMMVSAATAALVSYPCQAGAALAASHCTLCRQRPMTPGWSVPTNLQDSTCLTQPPKNLKTFKDQFSILITDHSVPRVFTETCAVERLACYGPVNTHYAYLRQVPRVRTAACEDGGATRARARAGSAKARPAGRARARRAPARRRARAGRCWCWRCRRRRQRRAPTNSCDGT